MSSHSGGRFGLRDLVELAFLPILTAAVWVLYDMNKNISQLNVSVGIILSERVSTLKTLEDHELRIRVIESNYHGKGRK